MLIDFMALTFRNIEGKVIKQTVIDPDTGREIVEDGKLKLEPMKGYRILGNLIFQKAQKDLSLVEASQGIYKGDKVDLSDDQIKTIKEIFRKPVMNEMTMQNVEQPAFMIKQLEDFLDDQVKKAKEKIDSENNSKKLKGEDEKKKK